MWKILLTEFTGDLREQRTRAFLTLFAIAWGTIAIVLLLAFGEGLKNTMMSGLLNAGDRVIRLYGGETGMEYQGLPKGRRISLTESDLELIEETIPEVDIASPSYGRWGVTLEVGDRRTTTFLEAVQPGFEEVRRMFPAAGGRFLNEVDVAERRRVLFMGDSLRARLFGPGEGVGEMVMLDGVPFTVVGVMPAKFQTSMNNGPDNERAIIPASTYQAIYGGRYVNHLLIRPRDVRQTSYVTAEVYRVLGSRHGFHPEDERALGVWDFVEDERITRRIFLGIQLFLGLVGVLTLIVAGVGVANIMYVVVRERTREIGIKLAVGARKSHIMAQVVFEALAIALTGGIAGLVFSAAVVYAVDSIPNKSGAAEFLANPELSLPVALATVMLLTVIGLAAGFFPARRAAAMDPVESLRYE